MPLVRPRKPGLGNPSEVKTLTGGHGAAFDPLNGIGVVDTRCSQTCRMPAAVRNNVMNTIAIVISQKDHISTTWALLLLASRPRMIGMA